MKIDATDIADLAPLIRLAVIATLEQQQAAEAKLDAKRLGFPEGEAATLLGVQRHVLRDCRLRGEIQAVRLGKGFIYSRDTLVKFLRGD